MLEDQAGLFERMVGNGTLATTSELMLSTDYWQALGTSFVDVVRGCASVSTSCSCIVITRLRVFASTGRQRATGRVGGRGAHV